jgi:RNA polymerase sigma-70 factor (ECF subfamily)
MPTTLDVPTRASLLLAAGDPANEKAREAFAGCYGGLIRDWCHRSGVQEADQDDVVQTILLRLLKMLPAFQYDPRKRFRGLVHRAVYRAIVDLYRERQRHPGGYGSGNTGVGNQLHEVPAPDDPAVEDLTQELARQADRNQQLQEACERVRRRVKPHNWQAFWLTTVEGDPVAEVAQQLGMTEGAVLVAKHRVIKMIRSEVPGMA